MGLISHHGARDNQPPKGHDFYKTVAPKQAIISSAIYGQSTGNKHPRWLTMEAVWAGTAVSEGATNPVPSTSTENGWGWKLVNVDGKDKWDVVPFNGDKKYTIFCQTTLAKSNGDKLNEEWEITQYNDVSVVLKESPEDPDRTTPRTCNLVDIVKIT